VISLNPPTMLFPYPTVFDATVQSGRESASEAAPARRPDPATDSPAMESTCFEDPLYLRIDGVIQRLAVPVAERISLQLP
jgi:hypothetical protein